MLGIVTVKLSLAACCSAIVVFSIGKAWHRNVQYWQGVVKWSIASEDNM